MARGKTPAPDTLTGTVKSLHNDKGFGFLVDDGGVEYFFHRSACPAFDDLARGTVVRFTMTTGTKGPRAENVEVI